MRSSLLILAAVVATTLMLTDAADARRMGGGRSFGAQRESIAPARPAATPSPAAPASNAPTQPASSAAAIAPKATPAATAAPSGMSRWLGPIAGIAAGLGLAALLSHFGLSEGLGSILLIGLAIMAGVFLLRMFLGRRSPAAGPRGYVAAGSAPAAAYDGTPVGYNPSPDPAWRAQAASEPEVAAPADVPTFGVARKPLPAGFDAVAFAREAKRQYVQVQALYDRADREALANVMTAEMASEVRRELDERVGHQPTEVVSLEADVLDVATEADKYWVSVRFTGLVREDGQPVPTSIDEVWNLTKPIKGASGWLLAGISQLA
jgi:predicted lipid-binding transport protein (Tim44 family)